MKNNPQLKALVSDCLLFKGDSFDKIIGIAIYLGAGLFIVSILFIVSQGQL